MKYWYFDLSNGYCGCDEKFVMKTDDNVTERELYGNLFDYYSYADGFAGMYEGIYEDDFDEYYTYEDAIMENSVIKEICEKEYYEYIENGGEEEQYFN